VGLATLRISGVYFVIFTLGLAELVRQIMAWAQEMTCWFALTQGRYRQVIEAARAGHQMAPQDAVSVQLAGQEAKAWARMGDRRQVELALAFAARLYGQDITSRLLDLVTNDVGDESDQLPVMQHALMRTWDHWQTHRRNGEPIRIEHYEAIGTMSDALSRHADEAFNELPDDRSRKIADGLHIQSAYPLTSATSGGKRISTAPGRICGTRLAAFASRRDSPLSPSSRWRSASARTARCSVSSMPFCCVRSDTSNPNG